MNYTQSQEEILRKTAQFQKDFGFQKVYHSYDELLDDENIDAVYIPLPNQLHKEWTIRAARKKKHVLCEKPLAPTEEEVREVVDVCRQEGVLLMEAFAYLHSNATREVSGSSQKWRGWKACVCGNHIYSEAMAERKYQDAERNLRRLYLRSGML